MDEAKAKEAAMGDQGLENFLSFQGGIKGQNGATSITFRARVDPSGEVQIEFEPIPLTKETSFLLNDWHLEKREKLNYFTLSGRSEDGTEFSTEKLYFRGVQSRYDRGTGTLLRPIGGCSRAQFTRQLKTPASTPLLRVWLKGFRNFGELRARCPLGTIAMEGPSTVDDPDVITGSIAVQADEQPRDTTAWHADATRLLDHVRRIMSFASAVALHSPIIEFFEGNRNEITALSQMRQAPAPMPTFHYLNQQPVFEVAVNSFFNPPFGAKNLFFAIEWFAMETTHSEVRLVNAMTALENLIAANLSESEALVMPSKEYEKIRRLLRGDVARRIKGIGADAKKAEAVVRELNEKLAELNRRSLMRKMAILAQRWSVQLEEIGIGRIQAAKQARDRIVHCVYFYEADPPRTSDDLWEHVTVTREIIVRFLLAAIGYRGKYISYVGGYHDSDFPSRQ